MRTFLNRFGSIKLTLAVLLVLACVAAFGTFLPQGGDVEAWEKLAGAGGARWAVSLGLTDFYHSLWFTVLLALLVLNLTACTVNRIPGMLHALSGNAALGREAVFDLTGSDASTAKVVAALRSMGFRPGGKGEGQVYSRGSASYLFSLLTHGSILVIMASSIFGSSAGFVATQRLYVGDSTSTAFNWKAGGDRPLPFELRADAFTLVPNPVAVRLGVMEPATGKKGKAITTHEGNTFRVPGIKGRVRLESFDVDRKDYLASWTAPDGTRLQFGKNMEIGDTGISLVPIAFATWPERQALAPVTVVSELSGERSGDISVNHPMVFDGVRIYLTDYGKDKFGFPYVGFQFVRDPGQAGVWAGCILLLACLPGTVFVRHSSAVLVRESGRLRVHISSRENRDAIIEKFREELAAADLERNGGPGEA